LVEGVIRADQKVRTGLRKLVSGGEHQHEVRSSARCSSRTPSPVPPCSPAWRIGARASRRRSPVSSSPPSRSGSLVVSYGRGLFGWREAGFRPVIELSLIFEVAAVVLLSAALAATAASATRSP